MILDSGERRTFDTGAVRDITDNKGRCDLLPLDVVALVFDMPVLEHIEQFKQTGNGKHLVKALLSFSGGDYETLLLEVAKHFEEGNKKYPPDENGVPNWQKGIPTQCYIDSAVRHYLKHSRGDTDEPHDRAFCWNLLCCIWTCINLPELNDYAKN